MFGLKIKEGAASRGGMSRSRGSVYGFTIVELLIVVVVIAILAAITIVSYNGITNKAKESVKASDIASWKKKSEIHKIENSIVCPDNFVFIYGSALFGTSDFCVMKYEAKNVGGVAVSRPEGASWEGVTQTQAISYSAAACEGCKLIADAEWMTIVADVLSVKYNWSGGKVGEGYIYSGHNDAAPYNAISASANDDEGYINTGNSSSSGANQRRTLYLSSGDVIWDLPGNAQEWTDGVVTGAQPGLSTDSSNANTYAWKQWNDVGMNWNSLQTNLRPSSMSSIPGLSGIATWGGDKGIGYLYSNKNQTLSRSLRRGGYWDSGIVAGVLHLSLAHDATFANGGFRASR